MAGPNQGNHDWIAAMPPELARQQRALRALVRHCANTPDITSLSVGCSIGRGAADALSDIDAAIGVRAHRGAAGAPVLRSVEDGTVNMLSTLGSVVDLLRQEATRDDFSIRSLFVQYDDGLQLDLAIVAEAAVRRGNAAPDFVSLYQQPGPGGITEPSALHATPTQLREWAFLGWRALLDADKYLQRGSLWEAHQRLHETRDYIWKLWAAAQRTLYPWHGLSQVFDQAQVMLPDQIEATTAAVDLAALEAAVDAAAIVLENVRRTAERSTGVQFDTPLGNYVRQRLTERRRSCDP